MNTLPLPLLQPVRNNLREHRETLQNLALFRYRLRRFQRFSEQAAAECEVTPQQHQLLLGIAGHTSDGSATISELAEFLQERHNSVVELVGRAVKRGLVRKVHDEQDRRWVYVSLTARGEAVLLKLSDIHKREAVRLQEELLKPLEVLGSRGLRSASRRTEELSEKPKKKSMRNELISQRQEAK